MVKFSKQFEGQLIPEWKEAFVDYWQLKKDIKKIQPLEAPPNTIGTINKPITKPSIAQRLISPLHKLPLFSSHGHKDHGVIQVHKKLASSASSGDMYETELLEQFADTDAAKEFFARLDLQLNKVNQFYKGKEKEFLERGASLMKQMEILLDLKAALKQQKEKCSSKDDPSISCSLASEEGSARGPTIEEEQVQESPTLAFERNNSSGQTENILSSSHQRLDDSGRLVMKPKREEGKLRKSLSGRVISCQGKNLRINIPLTTPSRTFSALTYLVWEDLVSQSKKCGNEGDQKLKINKSNLHHAEKMIRGAFIELYKGLGYLSTYRNLNMLAFVKIMKKFDKVTGKQALPIYIKVVESSYFNSSDKAIKLMDEVEELFVKHFAEDDKRKAMKYLNPHQHKESHGVTFFIGLFTGCFVALLVGYCIMARIAGMYTRQSDSIYMETVYPVISMFSLLFLHLFLYGCNIFMWRKARINYSFIFEFAPTKELKYRDVFLICTASMTIVVGVMFAHLTLTVKGHSSSSTRAQAIPGILLLMFLMLLVCPFNIVYRSSRYCFLRILRNIILSPLYKVVMVDFFMADQLCSQVPMLRSLEYLACYYITGSYKTQDYGYCMRAKHFRDLAYAVSFLPYYWRAMQCARRWFDEGETSHLVNLGKYVSAMLAAGAKVAYEKEKSIGWLSLVVGVSSAATIYQLYWDFVKDWGLLQLDSKNPWLRNDLILRRKFVYYLSMGLNLLLRLAWLQTVVHPNFGSLDSRVTSLFLAALEVIRRGQWNFYRLENEHLNNAGKFRAVKTVPLPFHEVEQD
ncbi:phosphate transporter PHO1-3-like [Ananas comosus]|uniref:Phosphate transporter PHO1-3-like n=1 Tax=Ananas comosus TaxID=4615 RepID=A0A6P5F354_ANACO|nr:phosphate transporter PHO1-3-like [Ananas comosus]